MPIQSVIFLVTVFFIVFGIAITAMRTLFPSTVHRRLRGISDVKNESDMSGATWAGRVMNFASPLAKLVAPNKGWTKSALRTQFMNAGIRGETAPGVFRIAQIFLSVALPILLWINVALWSMELSSLVQLILLFTIAVTGFCLPKIFLSRVIKSRQRDISENMPNALDLLTICMEAGLVMDAGISRVSQEMILTSPALGEELYIVTLELRAGSNKETALRNLMTRTGVEEIGLLVSMLIQTERFGTSIADALRTHSEHLRVTRRQRAEESAAKIAVKLLLPLIFCIFPALFVVMLGPAVIQALASLAQSGS